MLDCALRAHLIIHIVVQITLICQEVDHRDGSLIDI